MRKRERERADPLHSRDKAGEGITGYNPNPVNPQFTRQTWTQHAGVTTSLGLLRSNTFLPPAGKTIQPSSSSSLTARMSPSPVSGSFKINVFPSSPATLPAHFLFLLGNVYTAAAPLFHCSRAPAHGQRSVNTLCPQNVLR